MEKMRRTKLNAPIIPHSKPKILTEIPISWYRKKKVQAYCGHMPHLICGIRLICSHGIIHTIISQLQKPHIVGCFYFSFLHDISIWCLFFSCLLLSCSLQRSDEKWIYSSNLNGQEIKFVLINI
jgi:hypothetical protein